MSLLDLDEGFLALPRKLCSSPFFQSLRADERYVFITMLLCARYAEGGEFYFAGKAIPLAVGQFIESEETLARLAGTRRRTARGILEKAVREGLISRTKVHPAGQCPHVTTISNYELIGISGNISARRPDNEPNIDTYNGRPADRTADRPHQNKENKGNKDNKGNFLPASPGKEGKAGKEEKTPDPRHRPLQDTLEAVFFEIQRTEYGFKGRDAKAITELLRLSKGDVAEVERRWRIGLTEDKYRRCDTIYELSDKWNKYAGAAPTLRSVTEPASAASEFVGGRRVL